MTDDKFGRQCPVCGKRITPAFLDRHIGKKHPTFDARKLREGGMR